MLPFHKKCSRSSIFNNTGCTRVILVHYESDVDLTNTPNSSSSLVSYVLSFVSIVKKIHPSCNGQQNEVGLLFHTRGFLTICYRFIRNVQGPQHFSLRVSIGKISVSSRCILQCIATKHQSTKKRIHSITRALLWLHTVLWWITSNGVYERYIRICICMSSGYMNMISSVTRISSKYFTNL